MIRRKPVFITREQVEQRTTIKRSKLYRLVKEGRFPRPVKLGSDRDVAWVEYQVEDWMASRIEASTEAA